MIKRLLKSLRKVNFINFPIRTAIKYLGHYSQSLYKESTAYWLVSGKITYRLSEEKKFRLYARADDAFTSKLFYSESWEDNVVYWITKFSAKADVFFDVGANIGFYTLVSAVASPGINIFSFEPNPINYDRLKKNLNINSIDNVKTEAKAVGASTGEVNIHLPELPYVSDVSSVYKCHSTSFNDFKHMTHEVEVVSLDEFCLLHNTFPDVIKIDVELYELEVLRGMKNILQKGRTSIFCEIFNDKVKRKVNKGLDTELPLDYTNQIDQLLKQYGYFFYLISDKGILYQCNLCSSVSSYMFLLLPKRLKQDFYLNQEADIVLNEIIR